MQAIAKKRAQNNECKSRACNGGYSRGNESLHTVGESTEMHERRPANEGGK